MKIKHKSEFGERKSEFLTDMITQGLDGSDYDQGRLEDLDHTVENLKHAFSNLFGVLVEKGVLSLEEAALQVSAITGSEYATFEIDDSPDELDESEYPVPSENLITDVDVPMAERVSLDELPKL
ncbi:hypothetical protein DRO66_00545 [Candidatus Bathyarchaeota archaeon]|nr:MAG: hypothetical protein DRO66_00545 [Candidatus Bathyarchaeota archaeon]